MSRYRWPYLLGGPGDELAVPSSKSTSFELATIDGVLYYERQIMVGPARPDTRAFPPEPDPHMVTAFVWDRMPLLDAAPLLWDRLLEKAAAVGVIEASS